VVPGLGGRGGQSGDGDEHSGSVVNGGLRFGCVVAHGHRSGTGRRWMEKRVVWVVTDRRCRGSVVNELTRVCDAQSCIITEMRSKYCQIEISILQCQIEPSVPGLLQ
jgi:hypothetical protein